MAMTKEHHGAMFCNIVRLTWSGAQAQAIRVGPWGEWEYAIKFKNEAVFKSDDPAVAFEQARVYAQSVKNLTGDWP